MNARPFAAGSRKLLLTVAALALAAGIGAVDYLTGPRILMAVFYFAPIFLAAWYAGKFPGLLTALVCSAVWTTDYLAYTPGQSEGVNAWNILTRAGTFFVFAVLWSALRISKFGLEETVKAKTRSLQTEINERKDLEKQLLHLEEKERQRIGRDLHDLLGQQLIGIALLAKDLQEQLVAGQPSQAAAAARIVSLINEAADHTRGLSQGLCPVELTANGLMTALSELAVRAEMFFKVRCVFQCQQPVLIDDDMLAVHLFRIAQESVTNAVKHGQAGKVVIRLAADDVRITLAVEDDGKGFRKPGSGAKPGLGLKLMQYRANSIAGALSVAAAPGGGTLVVCAAPLRGPVRSEEEMTHGT